MTLQVLLVGALVLLAGIGFTFAGYRLFLILLPLWAFVIGLLVGADAITALFGDGFLATVLGWATGFVLGLLFAVLSYLFWWAAVTLLGASIGYAIGSGVLIALGLAPGLLTLVAGIAVGIVVAGAFIVLNMQKILVIVATALGGAAAVLSGCLLLLGQISLADMTGGIVAGSLHRGWLYGLVWLALASIGVLAQVRASASFELDLRREMEGRRLGV